MLNAIILAGMQPIKNWNDNMNKALLRINGKSMIEYVIDALRCVDDINSIVVLGPKQELEKQFKDKVDKIIEAKGSLVENVIEGVKYLGTAHKLLICTSDIPMITSEAIVDFITKAKATEADICYPIVDKTKNNEIYPEIERTYVKVKDGTFTGGNIFCINPQIIETRATFAEQLIKFKKNPIRMARILGLSFMIQLITGTLAITKIEKRFSDILKINVKAIVSEYPELANDIDKASDVIIATAHLSK